MSRSRLFFGLVILVLGIAAFLGGLNLVDLGFWRLLGLLWPSLLIAWGLGFLLEPAGVGGKAVGIFVILIGLGFLGANLGWWEHGLVWRLIWPTILIGIGAWIILGTRGKSHLGILGGVEYKDKFQLDNGSYLAVMGGVNLDLRRADFDESRTLRVTALMGGVEIVVPVDMAVVCEGTALLGGVTFFGKSSGGVVGGVRAEQGDVRNAVKIVRIDCLAILGGVEVKIGPTAA